MVFCSSSRKGGDGELERPAMVFCSSSRKDGDDELAVLTNWPGRISEEPNTASAGENSLFLRKAAQTPSITCGRWSLQSAAAAAAAALANRTTFNHLWNHSTRRTESLNQGWALREAKNVDSNQFECGMGYQKSDFYKFLFPKCTFNLEKSVPSIFWD